MSLILPTKTKIETIWQNVMDRETNQHPLIKQPALENIIMQPVGCLFKSHSFPSKNKMTVLYKNIIITKEKTKPVV
jgi:hypothetical protein